MGKIHPFLVSPLQVERLTRHNFMPGQQILSEKYECRGGGEKQISTPSPESIMDQNTLAEGDGVPEGSSHTPWLSDRTPGCVSRKETAEKIFTCLKTLRRQFGSGDNLGRTEMSNRRKRLSTAIQRIHIKSVKTWERAYDVQPCDNGDVFLSQWWKKDVHIKEKHWLKIET